MIHRPWVPPQKAISCASTQVKPSCSIRVPEIVPSWNLAEHLICSLCSCSCEPTPPCKGNVYELYHVTEIRSSNRSFMADLGLKGRANKEEPNPSHLLSLPFQKHLTHLGTVYHVQNGMTACTPLVASRAQPSDLSGVTPGSTVHWHLFRSALQLIFFSIL